jgi:WD40 repeat protein
MAPTHAAHRVSPPAEAGSAGADCFAVVRGGILVRTTTIVARHQRASNLMSRVASCVSLFFTCVLIAGCGSSVDPPSENKKPANGLHAANTSETPGPSVETAAAVVAAEAQAAAPSTPPPTAEQIKQWTPAPFEPLVLLGIREWEKTSFTSRIAALPDGKHFLAVGSRVLLWAVGGTKPEHVFLELTAEDGDRHQQALAIAPDGKWFAVGDSEGTLRLWNLDDKVEIATKQIYPTGIVDLAISPDGKEIATISHNKEITVWNVPDLSEKKKFEVTVNFAKVLEYVKPQALAVAGETTSLWNTATGEKVTDLSEGRYTTALARSADGSILVFGAKDKLVTWDIETAKPVGEIAHEVSGREQVAFSPDGEYLAVNDGNSIQIWNLAEGRIVQVIDSFGWALADMCWLPATNLLAAASDIGITRIWGTPAEGAAVGLKPVHGTPSEFSLPATPAEMHGLIDLRVLPRLPGSEMSISGVRDLSCIVPVEGAEAMTFYRHFLTEAGWAEATTFTPNPAALVFVKNGSRITASFYPSGEGKTNVMLTHEGNLDMRTLPKFDGDEIHVSYESPDNLIYTTKADLLAIETNLLRKLPKEGWTASTRLNTSHNEQADSRDLEFVKNGVALRVSIGKFPNAPDQYSIQYSLFPYNASVPVPTDAGYVEFDGSTDPKLIAVTGMSLAETRDFYDKELAKEDWLERGRGHTIKDEYAWLVYLRDQSDVTIGLTKLPNGKTLVRVGEANGSLWENSQPKENEAGEEEDVAEGIEAADFPILNAAKTAKYDEVGKTIEVVMEKSTLAQAAQVYQKAIEALGWKHDGRGIRDEEYTFLTFEKSDKDFSLRAHPKEGDAQLSFSGDGLLWTKPLSKAKELVSYERWLRLNKLPPGLETLDRYEAEMKAIDKP